MSRFKSILKAILQSPDSLGSKLFLLIAVIIGYWPVSFLVYALKWDLIDVVFPFRYHFSEGIQSGYFPFWNPFQQTGTPFYADLQVPFYYPELLITSLLGGYGIYTMHFLYILYLWIASLGMYRLSYHFNGSKKASLVAGVAYAFSGFMIGHGQHFFLIVGAAWIPFVLFSYLKLNQEFSVNRILKTGIYLFLLVTGAYQALSIGVLYLLLILFIHFLIKTVKEGKSLKNLLTIHAKLAALILVLTLPLLAAVIEVTPAVNRLAGGVDLITSLSFSQPVNGLLTFLIPFLSIEPMDFFGNIDPSMLNHYIGTGVLLFALAALMKRRTAVEYIFFVYGVIIFSTIFDFLPTRELMFRHFPLMGLFRNAAYIRVFGLFPLILLGANFFAEYEQNREKSKKYLIISAGLLFTGLLIIFINAASNMWIDSFSGINFRDGLESIINQLTVNQRIIISSLSQILLMLAVFLLVFKWPKARYSMQLLVIILSLDLVWAAHLNMSSTFVDMKQSPVDMKRNLDLNPHGFPIPTNDKVIYNTEQFAFFEPFWRNTYIFTKQVAFGAFSSFELNSYSLIDDEYNNLQKLVLDNHLFYLSDTLAREEFFVDGLFKDESNNKVLVVSEEDYEILSNYNALSSPEDRITLSYFSPNKMCATTQTSEDQYLTLIQSNYLGWRAEIDGQEVPIYRSNFNYQTIVLPKGEHEVVFKYKNNLILLLYIISNLLFFGIVLYLIRNHWYHSSPESNMYLILPGIILVVLSFSLVSVLLTNNEKIKVSEYYDLKWNPEDAYLAEQPSLSYTIPEDSITYTMNEQGFQVLPEMEYVTVFELEQNNDTLKSGVLKVKMDVQGNDYTEAIIVSEVGDEWYATKVERQIERPKEWNPVRVLRHIPDLDRKEMVKVYIWNPEGETFSINNLQIELFED
ncbi:MAG TPA: hypothetical protein DDX92_02970 [Flavobacteriales bacterium]|jgi:hypothetical protein|nr:hypothetical protein [Flavobacteriales bacterium]